MVVVLALVLGTTTTAWLPFFHHATERFILTWKAALSIKRQLPVKSRLVFSILPPNRVSPEFSQGCFALLTRNVLSSN
jgi:hypothetical protein